MRKTFTLSMSWLHTWAGLVLGWILFGVLLTGSIAVFHSEITYWASPEVRGGLHPSPTRSLLVGQAFLERQVPNSRMWRIELPSGRSPALKVSWRNDKGATTVRQLDPETGAAIARETDAGGFFLDYHYMLNIDRTKNMAGFLLVGLAGVGMLVASISGIVVHKRIFKDFFLFRPRGSGQRAWLDGHNLLAVLPLPFHIMMAYTGLVILYWVYIPAAVHVLYQGKTEPFRREAIALEYRDFKTPAGGPAPLRPLPDLLKRAEDQLGVGKIAYVYVRDPGRSNATFEAYRSREDYVTQQVQQVALSAVTGATLRVRQDSPAARTQSFIAALHFIEWGGPIVRWFYFLAGLASTGMVASGLIVFVRKRAELRQVPAWLPWVDRINVAAMAGITLACIAFLWAERLTPAAWPHRIDGPVMAFFWTWAAAAIHAAVRPPARAWTEQLGLTAALCIGAPLLNGLGWRNLVTLDTVRLGMDLTLVASGICLLAIAWAVSKAGGEKPAKSAKSAKAAGR